jgi:hypothetical protein
LYKGISIDGGLSLLRPEYSTNLILDPDVLVTSALRDERGACAVEGVELVCQESLESVPHRLNETEENAFVSIQWK